MLKRLGKYCFPVSTALLALIVVGVGVFYYQNKQKSDLVLTSSTAGLPYLGNILTETEKNTYFRKVLFTGASSQLVVMDILPGGEVGEETHANTEQTLFFLSGVGKAILNGKESQISAGDVVVVTPGTRHNFINTGTDSLKIYTIYTPPNHIDGRMHLTKVDADTDFQDEAYGERAK